MEKHQVRIQHNKLKISAPTWNDTFDLPAGSYSVSDIQDYFGYIIKKQETLTENPQVQIYPNKIKNRIVLKIKTGYKLELLTLEITRLLGSAKKVADKDKYGKIVPKVTGEVTGDLTGNKIADKINSIGKPKEKEKRKEIEEIYFPPERRQQIIDDLRLFRAHI